MANVLSKEKTLGIIRCLVEGSSIRSTERIVGVSRNTVMKVLVEFGNACHDFLDARMNNLQLDHVQADEIWTFVGKKQKNVTKVEKRHGELGDQYLFLGMDTDTKLIASFKIGKRNEETTREFVEDLAGRMYLTPDAVSQNRPQISTDGWGSYKPTIRESFDGTVRHGVLIKNYVNPEVGRYSPPSLMRAEKIAIDEIEDKSTICTSHIERHNLSIRTFMKRFTRLSMGFSKKLDNLKSAVSIHVAYYNFCWRLREKGKSGKLTPTPAEQAQLTDHTWTIEELYDTVMDHQDYKELSERVAKLAEKLGLK